jgi:hypothetical protein
MARPKHTCHWPGCPLEVPPHLWGCSAHWRALPVYLRINIRAHYRRGQEIDKRPSKNYLLAVLEANRWIEQHGNWVEVTAELPDFRVYGFHLSDAGEQRLIKVRVKGGPDRRVPYQGWGLFGFGNLEDVNQFTATVTHWQRELRWEHEFKGNAAAHDVASKGEAQ